MSAKSAQKCSVVTLPEFGGLIRNMIQQLEGPNRQFWLKAYRMMSRKKNPWVRFQEVVSLNPRIMFLEEHNYFGRISDEIEKLGKLEECRIDVSTMRNYIGDQVPKEWKIPLPETDFLIVAVRLSDMLSQAEIGTLSYPQILEKAWEENGFEPIDFRSGLLALQILIKNEMGLPANSLGFNRLYVCCPESKKDNDLPRSPYLCLREGDCETKGALFASSTVTEKQTVGESINPVSGLPPDAILLFRSVI